MSRGVRRACRLRPIQASILAFLGLVVVQMFGRVRLDGQRKCSG